MPIRTRQIVITDPININATINVDIKNILSKINKGNLVAYKSLAFTKKHELQECNVIMLLTLLLPEKKN